MRRAIRFVWVLAANSFVAWLTITRVTAAWFNRESRDFQVWLELIVQVLLPVIGIVLEAAGRQYARFVNIAYLIAAGCYWLAAAVYWRADPFFGVMLIISFGFFVLAGVTEIVYRRTGEPKTI